MKIIISVITLFAALAAKADDIKLPHVSVSGTAEIKVVPDEMHWSLGVETKGGDIAQVAAAHDQKVVSVLKFLKEQKIEDKNTQTSRIELSENWVNRDRERVKEGYIASAQIAFESANLEQYRELWMGLAKIPDVSVKGVGFDTSKRIDIQNEARLNAVKAAKEKAESLAKALGASIHEPLVIEENSATWPGMYNTRNTFAAAPGQGANGTSLAPGTISVTSRVQVKFRISGP